MKFVCGTAELSEACLNVQRAVSTKTSIPAVEGILIKAVSGQLILTGYDLELGINTAIKATVEEELDNYQRPHSLRHYAQAPRRERAL